MHTILNWMKQFLILYLVLTILMQLAAAEEYKKYLRFLSGMILLLVLISPMLRLLGSDSGLEVLQSYEQFWAKMDEVTKNAWEPQILQSDYGHQTYESAISADITAQAREQGILVSKMSVDLSADYQIHSVTVWLDMSQKQENPSVEEQMLAFLKNTYQLEESQIFIY